MSLKGIVLAGGSGTRLLPMTRITNKHLLPVYDKPMIYYPLNLLKNAGIRDVLIVSGRGHAGDFVELLGSGREFGVNLSYEVQETSGGIAQALSLGERFAGDSGVAVILGDNIFEEGAMVFDAINSFSNVPKGAVVFLKEVSDPQRFGVAEILGEKIVKIEEKPENPVSNLAVTGLYLYDNKVWDIIKTLKPSDRGELEITDVNNFYVEKRSMNFDLIHGWWTDAGTIESLYRATKLVAEGRMGI